MRYDGIEFYKKKVAEIQDNITTIITYLQQGNTHNMILDKKLRDLLLLVRKWN